MRTETRTIYKFDELPTERAKEKARDWWRQLPDALAWGDEWLDSARAFCEEFGAKLTDWSVGPYQSLDYTVRFDNSNFRGRKLSEFKPDRMPTGFCGDCDFWESFYQEFKRTGSAKCAFDHALFKGFCAWRDDMESQLEDSYIDETLTANEYEFDENGEII